VGTSRGPQLLSGVEAASGTVTGSP
jgi:hypothetical protein